MGFRYVWVTPVILDTYWGRPVGLGFPMIEAIARPKTGMSSVDSRWILSSNQRAYGTWCVNSGTPPNVWHHTRGHAPTVKFAASGPFLVHLSHTNINSGSSNVGAKYPWQSTANSCGKLSGFEEGEGMGLSQRMGIQVRDVGSACSTIWARGI